MPSTTHESSELEILDRANNSFESKKVLLPDILHETQNERLVFSLSKKFNSLSGLEIPNYGKADFYFPAARLILDDSLITKEKSKWLKSVGLEVANIKPKPHEKLSEFSLRILEILINRSNQIKLRRMEIQAVLLETPHHIDQHSFDIHSVVNTVDFILNYVESQNIKGRNNFSILELAAGNLGDRGYGQKGELYVPLICEVLTRSGFAVDGIDKYADISAQNLDFGKVQGIDLTDSNWEKDIKHNYDMVIFLRDWHSEVFLQRFREESKVVIFENDFLVEDFVRNLMPKVHDILEEGGVFVTTHPFKKKDLFDIEKIFGRFDLDIFYNLDGLILARKKGLVD